jgi:hypothetical protein
MLWLVIKGARPQSAVDAPESPSAADKTAFWAGGSGPAASPASPNRAITVT